MKDILELYTLLYMAWFYFKYQVYSEEHISIFYLGFSSYTVGIYTKKTESLRSSSNTLKHSLISICV